MSTDLIALMKHFFTRKSPPSSTPEEKTSVEQTVSSLGQIVREALLIVNRANPVPEPSWTLELLESTLAADRAARNEAVKTIDKQLFVFWRHVATVSKVSDWEIASVQGIESIIMRDTPDSFFYAASANGLPGYLGYMFKNETRSISVASIGPQIKILTDAVRSIKK